MVTATLQSDLPPRRLGRGIGGALNRVLLILLLVICTVWLVVPFGMGFLWSVVDPEVRWDYPDILPPAMSFGRWAEVWRTTALPDAMANSYTLAPTVAIVTLILAAPTAYCFARFDFPGKNLAQILTLLPLVIPGFVLAIFFSALIFSLNIYSRFLSIVLAHTVLFLPYAIRILTVAFAQVRQDLIDAARDLGASPIARFRAAYVPVLIPGVLASLIIVFTQSIEEFAIAFIVGAPDFVTIPSILYSYLGYNFIRPNAAVVSLILVVPNVLLMLGLERLLRQTNPGHVGVKG